MMENQFDNVVLENLNQIQQKVTRALMQAKRDADSVQLMAVTKTVSPTLINTAIDAGVCLLGENRVQEFLEKYQAYHLDHAKVHFIGQLQTNKVKYIIDKVSMIESVSSIKLALEIEKQARKHDIHIDVLLQINIAKEESKAGFLPEELQLAIDTCSQFENVHVKGLMCIPPKGDTERYFCKIQQIFIDISRKNIHNISMDVLSMGMSQDYQTAIQYGATIVRLGTALFGARDYTN